MSSLSSSDDSLYGQRETYNQTQKPWPVPSTYYQPPEEYAGPQQYSPKMPVYHRRMPQDYRSTPGLVHLNVPKEHERSHYAPPAPTNRWAHRDDYRPPGLGAMATNFAPPVPTDPLKKPSDHNDEQLNRHIKRMEEKIDRLMAQHKAESEVRKQELFIEMERITDQTIEQAVRRSAFMDDETLQRLALRFQGDQAPSGQRKGGGAKASDHRLRRSEERLRAGDRSVPRPHVSWQEDPQHRPTNSENENVDMTGAVPVMSRRTPRTYSRYSNNARLGVSVNPKSQHITRIPRPTFRNEQNVPISQRIRLESAPREAPTPPPPVRAYRSLQTEKGKTSELRNQTPLRSSTKLDEPLRTSWTRMRPNAQDEDIPTEAKSPEKFEIEPESTGTNVHPGDSVLEEVQSDLHDQGQSSSEKTTDVESQDPDTEGYDVPQQKASFQQGTFRAPYVSDDHDEYTNLTDEETESATESRRQGLIGFGDNNLSPPTNHLTLPPEMRPFLEPSLPVASEMNPIAPTPDGSSPYSSQVRHRPSNKLVEKRSDLRNQPLEPGRKANGQINSGRRRHLPPPHRFKQNMYDAMLDALCDARHVFQAPIIHGIPPTIPTIPLMHQFVVHPGQIPKRRSDFEHPYTSSEDESEKSINRTLHRTRRYRRRPERSGPLAASDTSRAYRPSNMSHAPDDLQGSTYRQEFQIESLASVPRTPDHDVPCHVARDCLSPRGSISANEPARTHDERRCEQHCNTLVSLPAADQQSHNQLEKVLSRYLESSGKEAQCDNSSDSESDQSFRTASTGGSRRGSMSINGEGVMELPKEAIHVSRFLADESGDLILDRNADINLGHGQQYPESFDANTTPFTDGPPSVPTPPSPLEEAFEEDGDSHHSPTHGVRMGQPAMLMIPTTSPSYYLVPLNDDTHHAIPLQHHGGTTFSGQPFGYPRSPKVRRRSRIPSLVSMSRIRQKRHKKYRDDGTESSEMSNESY